MKKASRHLLMLFILSIWFVISFITNILGPLMPAIIDNYNLSLTLAAFLPFSFFLAYGIMSIPAGMLIEKTGEKYALLTSFGIIFGGSLLYSLFPSYLIALSSLFIIGAGMAMLQVVLNPLMRQVGGDEHFAFNAVLAQLVFGVASFLSPFVFTWLMKGLRDSGAPANFFFHSLHKIVPPAIPWISLYWLFTVVTFIMLFLVWKVKIPSVKLKEDEKAGSWHIYIELLKNKKVGLYFLGIMAYVGTEQGLSNWMSKFLHLYHGFNPEIEGASAVAWFWGLMSVGCLAGLLILKLMDSRKVLVIFTSMALLCLLLAVYGPSKVAFIAFPTTGFFLSVMFSIIFSLALNSVPHHHGSFSGILCAGIFGGALVPLIIGWLGDHVGLRIAMLFLVPTMGYILAIPLWAKPLVNNKITTVQALFHKNSRHFFKQKE